MPIRNPLKLIGLAICLAAVQFPVQADVEGGAKAIQRGEFEKAFSEWRPLAEKGDTQVQAAIAVMYHAGQGVPQDYEKAFQWYRRAAEKGNAASQANLGVLYAKGVGVPRNMVQAYVWFSLAAMQGDAGHARARDRLARQLDKAQLAEARRIATDYAAKYVTPFRRSSEAKP